MDKFTSCMDKVKAEEDLKLHTIQYVQNALNNKNIIQISKRKEFSQMKKLIIAACAVFVAGIAATGGYLFYETPSSYVSLDINPSVELGVNHFDQVVSVEAANNDGQNLIDALDVTNKSVEDAISELVQEAADQDYIADDGSSVIAVTAESNNAETALKLQEKSSQGVNLAMSTKNIYAAVYADCSDLSLRTEAKELNLSPGKYKMIKMLQSLDPTINVADFTDVKVKDIISKANELLASGKADLTAEEAKAISEKVKTAKENAEQAKQKAEQNKGSSGKKNGLETTGAGEAGATNKNQNQGSVQNKEQEQETKQGKSGSTAAIAQQNQGGNTGATAKQNQAGNGSGTAKQGQAGNNVTTKQELTGTTTAAGQSVSGSTKGYAQTSPTSQKGNSNKR